jgi:hypothetical protein
MATKAQLVNSTHVPLFVVSVSLDYLQETQKFGLHIWSDCYVDKLSETNSV